METSEKINGYEAQGFYFRGVAEVVENEKSIEDPSNFDDVVYAANKFCGEESYEINSDNLNEYFESKNIPYTAKKKHGAIVFVADGVNAATSFNAATDFNAAPNAKIIIVFEGEYVGRNMCDDGDIVRIIKIIDTLFV